MEQETVRLAVYVPEALLEEIDQYAAEHQSECVIERKVVPPDPQAGQALAFDPITLSTVTWVALKFVGPAVANIALGLVANVIYDRLKARAKQEQTFEGVLRFPTGESMTFSLNAPLDKKLLEQRIQESKNV